MKQREDKKEKKKKEEERKVNQHGERSAMQFQAQAGLQRKKNHGRQINGERQNH